MNGGEIIVKIQKSVPLKLLLPYHSKCLMIFASRYQFTMHNLLNDAHNMQGEVHVCIVFCNVNRIVCYRNL